MDECPHINVKRVEFEMENKIDLARKEYERVLARYRLEAEKREARSYYREAYEFLEAPSEILEEEFSTAPERLLELLRKVQEAYRVLKQAIREESQRMKQEANIFMVREMRKIKPEKFSVAEFLRRCDPMVGTFCEPYAAINEAWNCIKAEERAKKMGIKGFLMKPVILSELSSMVRTVLDGGTPMIED